MAVGSTPVSPNEDHPHGARRPALLDSRPTGGCFTWDQSPIEALGATARQFPHLGLFGLAPLAPELW
jgi:hypothetical protein